MVFYWIETIFFFSPSNIWFPRAGSMLNPLNETVVPQPSRFHPDGGGRPHACLALCLGRRSGHNALAAYLAKRDGWARCSASGFH